MPTSDFLAHAAIEVDTNLLGGMASLQAHLRKLSRAATGYQRDLQRSWRQNVWRRLAAAEHSRLHSPQLARRATNPGWTLQLMTACTMLRLPRGCSARCSCIASADKEASESTITNEIESISFNAHQ